MDIQSQLLKEHSRGNAHLIADYILQNPQELGALIEIFKNGELQLAQRAAWPVGIIGEETPHLLLPYLKPFLILLKNPAHDAVSRNIYRTLQFVEIPENLCSAYFDQCLHDVIRPSAAIAIKAFAMTVAFHIGKRFPDLKPELKMAIESQGNHSSAGLQNRAHKILKQL